MAKCKVTVIKTFHDEEMAKKYLKHYTAQDPQRCPYFKEGQSFMLDEKLEMPEGFCPVAWQSAIDKYACAMVNGAGGFFEGEWMKEENQMITCCIDGVRPVAFLLERIDLG